jgi:hypothetical protein
MTDQKEFDPLAALRRPVPRTLPSMAPPAVEPEPLTEEELDERMNETLGRKYLPGLFWGA